MSVAEKLLARRSIEDGCWIWTGAIGANGYGQVRSSGATRYTHRLAYEAFVGPIPEGLQIDHLCRVRACFNPTHLEAVAQAENIRRGLSGAHNGRKTHCRHGHPYTPENTYVVGKNQRSCATCRRVRRQEKKAAA